MTENLKSNHIDITFLTFVLVYAVIGWTSTGHSKNRAMYFHTFVQGNVLSHICTGQCTFTHSYRAMYFHTFVQGNVLSHIRTGQCTFTHSYRAMYFHTFVQGNVLSHQCGESLLSSPDVYWPPEEESNVSSPSNNLSPHRQVGRQRRVAHMQTEEVKRVMDSCSLTAAAPVCRCIPTTNTGSP